jgi:UDP-N-acetylmuramoyl-tripeptide--D-alanyl-D-alanine ligase
VEWKPRPRVRPPLTLGSIYTKVVRIAALTVAAIWRRLMFRTTVVAVTGSVGKTTAKDCIAAILSSRYRIESTPRSDNHFHGIGLTLLRIRPWHRFAVVEVAIDQPGQMKWFGRVVRPDIAIWLGAARTHTREFASLAHIASEKSLLIDSLARGGTAILNDDDPFVHSYGPPKHARTVRFGSSTALRADRVESAWPERFSFTVHHGGRSERVRTKLVGTHWMPSVLAAIAVGIECGFRLDEMLAPLAQVEPLAARLSPQVLPNGATLLRDENNGSVDTFDRALKVLSEATAGRKILVIGDLSDANQRWQLRSRRIAAEAAACANVAVFVGERAEKTASNAIKAGMNPDNVFWFLNLQQAAELLKRELRSGDLVLVKGRGVDKLPRISLALTRHVTCWRPTCTLHEQCDFCPELSRPLPQS